MLKKLKLQILCFSIIFLLVALFTNNYVENFSNEVPAIIFMRHGKEIKGTAGKPDKTYEFGNYTRTLKSTQQTLDPDDPYGIKGAKLLFNKLNSKIQGKYKPIDTIITIDTEPNGNNYPTANPFLTAYYYLEGDTNKTIKNFKLIDSKAPTSGVDGCDVKEIQPKELFDITKTNGSVLVIGTRDTLWGNAPPPNVDPNTISADHSRLLYKYRKFFNTDQNNPPEMPKFPEKEKTVHIFSGEEGKGKLEKIEINQP